jgi:hypothetical protein
VAWAQPSQITIGNTKISDRPEGSHEACQNDREIDGYVAALNSLWKVDSAQALNTVGKVLVMRDPCLTRLREQALLIILQRPKPMMTMAPVIFDVARNDPDSNIRNISQMWLRSQKWDPQAAKFLRSIFGYPFKVKTKM